MTTSGRVWLFPLSETLSSAKADEVLRTLKEFVGGWKAHGAELTAEVSLPYDRFVAITADESDVAASGCSIDEMHRAVKRAVESQGVSIVPNSAVLFRDGGEIRAVERSEFRMLARDNRVNAQTVVFDVSVRDAVHYANGKWELPAGESWHRELL